MDLSHNHYTKGARAINRRNGSLHCLLSHTRVVVRHAAGLPPMVQKWFRMLISRASRFRGREPTWRKNAPRCRDIPLARGNECVIKARDTQAGLDLWPGWVTTRAVNKACNARRSRTSLFARVHPILSPALFLAAFVSAALVPLLRRIPAFADAPTMNPAHHRGRTVQKATYKKEINGRWKNTMDSKSV